MKIINSFILIIFMLTSLVACNHLGYVPPTYFPSEEVIDNDIFDQEVYYFDSTSGNDNYDGLSADSPWKTIDKLNSEELVPYSKVFFKCGETYRGNIIAKSNICYTSYGDGNKPLLLGSINGAIESQWIDLGENLWKYNAIIDADIGNMIFDNEICGYKKFNIEDLTVQNDFFYEKDVDRSVYLYSTKNPTQLYTSIEIALTEHIIKIPPRTSNVSISSLQFAYGGAHGVSAISVANISVVNCEFNYIGGGVLRYDGDVPIRYGNAIEFYLYAKDILVNSNVINNIYDSGITHQNWDSTSTDCIMESIMMKNNIINNCGLAAYEFNNSGVGNSIMKNIIFQDNVCLNSGYGFGGEQRPDKDFSSNILAFPTNSVSTNIIIKNNTLYNAVCANIGIAFPRKNFEEYDIDFNSYYSSSEGNLIAIYENSILDTFPTTYNGLTDWQARNGKDLNSSVKYDDSNIQEILNKYF